MKKLLFILLFISALSAYAQLSPPPFYSVENVNEPVLFQSNVVYPSVGSVIFGGFTINYERKLTDFAQPSYSGFATLRLGYGRWASWGGEGDIYLLASNWIWGQTKHHLETGAGVAYIRDIGYSNWASPVANIGYRYQKKDGWLVFRTAVGIPEWFVVSLGIAF